MSARGRAVLLVSDEDIAAVVKDAKLATVGILAVGAVLRAVTLARRVESEALKSRPLVTGTSTHPVRCAFEERGLERIGRELHLDEESFVALDALLLEEVDAVTQEAERRFGSVGNPWKRRAEHQRERQPPG